MSLDTKTENEELLNGAVRVETSDLDVCVGVAVPILSLSGGSCGAHTNEY